MIRKACLQGERTRSSCTVSNTVARSMSTRSLKPTSSMFERRVQELWESRGGRPGLPVLMSLTVSVDVKQH